MAEIASVDCLKQDILEIDLTSCVGKGGFGKVYNAVLLPREPVCVKLFDVSIDKTEIIKEAILLTVLNTSEATPRCRGIVLVQDRDFHPIGIVQDVITCGLEGRNTLTLKELLDLKETPADSIWSDLQSELRRRLQLVHDRGVAMNDISLQNILLQWDGKSYIPFFIDMGLAKYRDDPLYDPQIDWKQLEKILEEHFPKPKSKERFCLFM